MISCFCNIYIMSSHDYIIFLNFWLEFIYITSMSKKRITTNPKNKRQIHINKYTFMLPFILGWFLYYFCYFFAKESPLYSWINSIWGFVFWESGILIIAWLAIIYGFLGIFRENFIWNFFKQFAILWILISSFMNITMISSKVNDDFVHYWWYISWIPIQILKSVFGANIFAIQLIIILWILAICIWIRYTMNISIPNVNFVYKNSEIKNPINIDNNKNLTKSFVNPVVSKSSFFWWIFDKKIPSDNQKSQNDQDISTQDKLIPKNNIYIWAWHDTKDDLKDKIKKDLLSRVWILTPEKSKIASHQSQDINNITNNNNLLSNNVITKKFDFDAEKPTFDTKWLSHATVKNDDIVDDIYIQSRARLIENKLAEFGIAVKTVSYNIWPSIIQIQIQPQAGVKLSKIESLKDDLLLALKTKTIRIIAPIAWTDLVGIEIANPSPSIVHLADIIESDNFVAKLSDNMTNLPIGKAIDGSTLIKSFESMPHLLVAGATGMGKSVTVNGFILSLIYQNNPQELRFIMIDPKQVEMELYSGIPHLLAPIVTDSEKALKALKRCVDEMEMRYTILKNHRVKNIYEYNELVSKEEKMSRIVIVIDELADLMLSSKLRKDVEIAITRIAQKARAIGMHLLIATQRPQVNVITGIIKANIPARISLGVISWIDSRTILDTKWAEDLMSKWDLLYIDPANRQPIRVQSPFISTSDTEKIIKMIKSKYLKWIDERSIYDQELLAILESNKWENTANGSLFANNTASDDDDELISQAMQLISGLRTASTTMLQRKLQIWFARAGRIMDDLERRGIVWPQEAGGKPRQVLM